MPSICLVPLVKYSSAHARAMVDDAERREHAARAAYATHAAAAKEAADRGDVGAARVRAQFAEFASCEARHSKDCGERWEKFADTLEEHEGRMTEAAHGG